MKNFIVMHHHHHMHSHHCVNHHHEHISFRGLNGLKSCFSANCRIDFVLEP